MSPKHDQNSIENRVRLAIGKDRLIQAGDRVVVALSGGPDSVCLLYLLLALRSKLNFSLEACHYNHRLRGRESDRDEEFVREICSDGGVELMIGRRADQDKIKSEDEARELRYNFFEKILVGKGREGTKIAIAHNMNDLAETLLMRLIRGGGLKGLSSILPRRNNFIRPLLYISRIEIEEYLNKNHHEYRIDRSNNQNVYFRNSVRNKLLPYLYKYNPNIVEKLAENAMTIAEDYDFIMETANKAYAKLAQESEQRIKLDAGEYSLLPAAIQNHLLMVCLSHFGAKDYTYKQISKINQLIRQNHGKKIMPLPHSLRFEFKSGNIYICKKESQDNTKENDGKSKKE